MKAKLRRKGWSDAKIDRWAQDRQNATGRGSSPRGARVLGAEEWAALIRHAIVEHGADHVGLLLHWYSGDLAEESVALHRTETVPLADLATDTLLGMEEDVLHLFCR